MLLLAAGAAMLAVVVAAIVWPSNDVQPSPRERARLVLRQAAERQHQPCAKRPRFTVYTLGERMHGEEATRLGARCDTEADEAEVFYGPCREGGESGCGNDISVRSAPTCDRPYALYTAFDGRGPKLITLRGVPAAAFEDRIELWTRDTMIIVSANPPIARKAVDALRPAAQTTATGASLPKPAAGVMSVKLRNPRCRA